MIIQKYKKCYLLLVAIKTPRLARRDGATTLFVVSALFAKGCDAGSYVYFCRFATTFADFLTFHSRREDSVLNLSFFLSVAVWHEHVEPQFSEFFFYLNYNKPPHSGCFNLFRQPVDNIEPSIATFKATFSKAVEWHCFLK